MPLIDCINLHSALCSTIYSCLVTCRDPYADLYSAQPELDSTSNLLLDNEDLQKPMGQKKMESPPFHHHPPLLNMSMWQTCNMMFATKQKFYQTELVCGKHAYIWLGFCYIKHSVD